MLFLHARNDPIVDFQRVRTDDFKYRHTSEAKAHGSARFLCVCKHLTTLRPSAPPACMNAAVL